MTGPLAIAAAGRGKLEFLVSQKIRHKLLNLCKSSVKLCHGAGCINLSRRKLMKAEPGWHGGNECAPEELLASMLRLVLAAVAADGGFPPRRERLTQPGFMIQPDHRALVGHD